MESGRDYFSDKSPFPSLEQLEAVRTVVARTETAMTQAHVFKAAQLSMQAQQLAEQ